MLSFTLIIIGFISGILAGMGLGGGSLLIPALLLFADVGQKTAQAANMIGFIPAAALSVIIHKKNNLINFRNVAFVALFGAITALITSSISVRMNNSALKIAFAIFLIVIGAVEVFKKKKE